jgi:hypothetical protein
MADMVVIIVVYDNMRDISGFRYESRQKKENYPDHCCGHCFVWSNRVLVFQ